jgi:tRNA-2-methylthio-N6-dimethylallyladenosine synthase
MGLDAPRPEIANSAATRNRPTMTTPIMTKKVFVKSLGCQMNVYDAERMKDVLAGEGYADTPDVGDADLVILNTCHIRERASEKVFSELGKLRELKEERLANGFATRIAVAGCVAQAEGGEILRRQSAVDLVIGPQSYHRFPELLRRSDNGSRVVDTEFPVEDKFDHLAPPSADVIKSRGVSAFVTIQEGCDKFCSFCVVPFTRGAEVSRPVHRVMEDARRLVDAGVAEITLLGQNVNAYHGADETGATRGLRHLFEQLAGIPGLRRIRYMTSHPNDFDDDLIAAHAEIEQVMPFVHLPVQSGSDRILKAMNRKHRVGSYLETIHKLRRARPDLALSSDLIVGFPGETNADFDDTLALMREVHFASVFSFKYSSRPGTKAADLTDQVDESVKAGRLSRLQTLEVEQRREFNESTIGRVMDVLFEKVGRHPGQIGGKSPYLQAVHVDGPKDLLGRVAKVKIVSLKPNSLTGELV